MVATSILAATERDDATITKKIILFLLGAAEEVVATITVGVLFVLSTPNAMRYAHRPTHGALLFFSFRGLTKKEINAIIELRRKVWG